MVMSLVVLFWVFLHGRRSCHHPHQQRRYEVAVAGGFGIFFRMMMMVTAFSSSSSSLSWYSFATTIMARTVSNRFMIDPTKLSSISSASASPLLFAQNYQQQQQQQQQPTEENVDFIKLDNVNHDDIDMINNKTDDSEYDLSEEAAFKFENWLLQTTKERLLRNPPSYDIQYQYQQSHHQKQQPLWESLLNKNLYKSKSQAKRACYMGVVVILRNTTTHNNNDNDSSITSSKMMENSTAENNNDEISDDSPKRQQQQEQQQATSRFLLGGDDPFHIVFPRDIIQIRTRCLDEYYPESVTKYVSPPQRLLLLIQQMQKEDENQKIMKKVHTIMNNIIPSVIYEDDYLAVVNKPENWTTIGSSSSSSSSSGDDRDDLQSILGFILHPPSTQQRQQQQQLTYYPRPVHRLDRATSGLVVIAKTKHSMQHLSKAFAFRNVQKTYTALVVVNGTKRHKQEQQQENPHVVWPSFSESSSSNNNEWNIIDYPIDGRSAISEYRWITTTPTTTANVDENNNNNNNTVVSHNDVVDGDERLALIQVKPHTGRMHQIRRHLAYCLNSPIVGDKKYDFGRTRMQKRKQQRQDIIRDTDDDDSNSDDNDGMYLCCHKLELPMMKTSTTIRSCTNPKSSSSSSGKGIGIVPSPPGCLVEITNTATTKSSSSSHKGENDKQQAPTEDLRLLHVSIPVPLKFQKRLQQQHHRQSKSR